MSAEQAGQALDALPPSTQAAVGALVAEHGPRARQHLAYQALGEWTPQQREAIRTLAAASPEVRAQAFSDGERVDGRVRASSEPTPGGASGEAGPSSAAAGGSPAQSGRPGAPSAPPPPPTAAQPDPGGNGAPQARAAARPRIATRGGRQSMNPAPAHLEAKLRFGWDFTVGQIAAMVAGILIGFAWANWLSPIHGIGAAVTGVYMGGLPVAAGFVASQTEFDLWAVVCLGGALAARGRALPARALARRPVTWCSPTSEWRDERGADCGARLRPLWDAP